MLSGHELASALERAMHLKDAKVRDAGGRGYGPTALAAALGITQPSASELLKTGRLRKDKYLLLVETFEDVVGPEHWGLPYTAQDMQLLAAFHALPDAARQVVVTRIKEEADRQRAAREALGASLVEQPAPVTLSGKRHRPAA